MADKFMTIDRMEDIRDKSGEVVGVQVWSPTGDTLRVKKGQGGKLKDRWGELEVGKAYSFTMGQFTPPGKTESFPFVADFKWVADELAQKALEKVEASQANTRDRSFALAYAKDLAVVGKILVSDVLRYASEYVDWLGGVTPEAQKAPEATEEKPIEYIRLGQRKRIDELAGQFGYEKEDIAKLVKGQGWKATSISKLTETQGDKLILLMDIGAVAEEEESKNG